MTEREFVDWVGDGRAEWVNGEVIIMSPINFEHADLQQFLFRLIGDFADEHDLGKVLAEPFQIRFELEKSRRSPDIIFVSNRKMSLMKSSHFEAARDLIVEIVSPDSQNRDRREKFLEYEKAGVREYWIVDPLSEKIDAFALGKDRKLKAIPEKADKIFSKVLSGFYASQPGSRRKAPQGFRPSSRNEFKSLSSPNLSSPAPHTSDNNPVWMSPSTACDARRTDALRAFIAAARHSHGAVRIDARLSGRRDQRDR